MMDYESYNGIKATNAHAVEHNQLSDWAVITGHGVKLLLEMIDELETTIQHREDTNKALTAQVEALQAELAETSHTVETLSSLLAKICDIVKGQPPELTLYSWHDLPEKVESMQADAARYKWLKSASMKGIAFWSGGYGRSDAAIDEAIASLEPAQVDKGDDSILFPGIRRSDAKKLGEIL